MRRIGALSVLLGIMLGWLYVGTLAWRAERLLDALPLNDDVMSMRSSDFGVGRTALIQARRLLTKAQYSSAQVEHLLWQALLERPLYAPAWLDLAELARRNGQAQDAVRYLDYARTLWPQRPVFLWRVALLLVELGQFKSALDALAAYWISVPQDGFQVIALVRRLQAEPAIWVEHLLQAIDADATETQTHYQQLLSVAKRLHDPELARIVWRYLPNAARQDYTLLFLYIDLLLAEAYYTDAATAWLALEGQTEGVHNGSFEQPLLNGGLGWHYRERSGFRIARDRQEYVVGEHSLLIHFFGSENVNFSDIWQRLIVNPGKRYRLHGYWKGYDVTTRSGVYLELTSVHPTHSVATASEPRYGSWPWERFELLLDVPDDVHLLEIRVRRLATKALDNLIAGKVWLDNLMIAVEEPAE